MGPHQRRDDYAYRRAVRVGRDLSGARNEVLHPQPVTGQKENHMSVTLLRPYLGFSTGAVVTLQDDTETALIAQGYATAANLTTMSDMLAGQIQSVVQGGNVALIPQGSAGYGTPAFYQGPLILPV